MKKILTACFASLIAMFCAGCVKISYNMEISHFDKVKVSEIKAVNLAPFRALDRNIDEKFNEDMASQKLKYKNKGYSVADYSDGVYTGIFVMKKDIDFVGAAKNLPDAVKTGNKNAFVKKKGFFKNHYKIELTFSMKDAIERISAKSPEFVNSAASGAEADMNISPDDKLIQAERYTDTNTGEIVETKYYSSGTVSKIRYKPQQNLAQGMNENGEKQEELLPVADFTIKTPAKAISHNATKVIGDREYQWNLATDNSAPVVISIEYEKYNFFNIFGFIATIIIMIFTTIVMNKKVKI